MLGAAALHPGTYREAAEDHLWAAATAGAHSLSDLDGEELHAALEARSVLDRSLDTLEAELVVPLRARLSENLEAAGRRDRGGRDGAGDLPRVEGSHRRAR